MSGPKRNRNTGAERAGEAVQRLLAPLFAARGFPASAILAEWPEIVGPALAAVTSPQKIVWPRQDREVHAGKRRRLEGATLTIRVAGPHALEIQRETDRILERLNVYFGWRAVTDLRMVQGPLRVARAPRQGRRQSGDAVPEDSGDRLEAALRKLGKAVKSA